MGKESDEDGLMLWDKLAQIEWGIAREVIVREVTAREQIAWEEISQEGIAREEIAREIEWEGIAVKESV